MWDGAWCADSDSDRVAAHHFTRIDEDIRLHFAPDRPYEYTGVNEDIVGTASVPGRYDRDVAEADRYSTQLDEVAVGYPAPKWRAIALARQGSLYDDLWAVLERAFLTYSPAQLAELGRIARTGVTPRSGDIMMDDAHAPLVDHWRARREVSLATASRRAVSLYAAAVTLARSADVPSPQSWRAEERLAMFAGRLGDAVMRDFVAHTKDPRDASGNTMLEYADGMYAPPSDAAAPSRPPPRQAAILSTPAPSPVSVTSSPPPSAPAQSCPPQSSWTGTYCRDPAVELAAGAQFAGVDGEIRGHFAPEAAGYEYRGVVEDVIGRTDVSGHVQPGYYQRDQAAADLYADKLGDVIDGWASPNWKAAAIARQGTLYDALWVAMSNAGPPRVAYFTQQQVNLLARLAQSGVVGPGSQATDLRDSVVAGWNQRKVTALAELSKRAVVRYAAAVALARATGVTNPQTAHALERLAAFTAVLGDLTMRRYVTQTKDPTDPSGVRTLGYTDGMYN